MSARTPRTKKCRLSDAPASMVEEIVGVRHLDEVLATDAATLRNHAPSFIWMEGDARRLLDPIAKQLGIEPFDPLMPHKVALLLAEKYKLGEMPARPGGRPPEPSRADFARQIARYVDAQLEAGVPSDTQAIRSDDFLARFGTGGRKQKRNTRPFHLLREGRALLAAGNEKP